MLELNRIERRSMPRLPVPAGPSGRALRLDRKAWLAAAKSGAWTPDRVVHLVGSLNETVFAYLRPATDALAQAGVEQCVVMIDEPRSVHFRERLDGRVLVAISSAEPGLLRRWKSSRDVFRRTVLARPPTAVHLHGLTSWMLGAGPALQTNPKVRLYYSPQGATLPGWTRALGAVLQGLSRVLHRESAHRAILVTNMPDAAVTVVKSNELKVIESPVHSVFPGTLLSPAVRPLMVTSGPARSLASALQFAQMAILLGDEKLGLTFSWIGRAEAESKAVLDAAGVGVFDATGERERARHLACGWIYLAGEVTPETRRQLVEAMALGLPCVAVDSPAARALIRNGATGFLCRDSVMIRYAIADLIHSPELRRRIGSAAKRVALERFGEDRFRDSVLSTYASDSV